MEGFGTAADMLLKAADKLGPRLDMELCDPKPEDLDVQREQQPDGTFKTVYPAQLQRRLGTNHTFPTMTDFAHGKRVAMFDTNTGSTANVGTCCIVPSAMGEDKVKEFCRCANDVCAMASAQSFTVGNDVTGMTELADAFFVKEGYVYGVKKYGELFYLPKLQYSTRTYCPNGIHPSAPTDYNMLTFASIRQILENCFEMYGAVDWLRRNTGETPVVGDKRRRTRIPYGSQLHFLELFAQSPASPCDLHNAVKHILTQPYRPGAQNLDVLLCSAYIVAKKGVGHHLYKFSYTCEVFNAQPNSIKFNDLLYFSLRKEFVNLYEKAQKGENVMTNERDMSQLFQLLWHPSVPGSSVVPRFPAYAGFDCGEALLLPIHILYLWLIQRFYDKTQSGVGTNHKPAHLPRYDPLVLLNGLDRKSYPNTEITRFAYSGNDEYKYLVIYYVKSPHGNQLPVNVEGKPTFMLNPGDCIVLPPKTIVNTMPSFSFMPHLVMLI